MAEKKIVLERSYTVPLRRGFLKAPGWERTRKAVAVLITFSKRHMKSDDVRIGRYVNELIWKNGGKNPPSKVKVDMVKFDDGSVSVELSGAPKVAKKKTKKPKEKIQKENIPKEEVQTSKEIEKEELKEIKKEKTQIKHPKDPTTAKDTHLRKKELIPGR